MFQAYSIILINCVKLFARQTQTDSKWLHTMKQFLMVKCYLIDTTPMLLMIGFFID